MKVHRRRHFVYFGCSSRYLGACNNTKFYRADKIERTMLPVVVDIVGDDAPIGGDPVAVLEQQISLARRTASEIERAYHRSMSRSGELAERTQAKLEIDYSRQTDEVTKLQRQLASLKSAKPVGEVQAMISGLLGAALSGDVPARTKIAAALPDLLTRLVCHKDGTLTIEFVMMPVTSKKSRTSDLIRMWQEIGTHSDNSTWEFDSTWEVDL
jgi:hypothetical protein